MKFDQWARPATLWLITLTALLSGCTTYVTTQVTAFSDWSGSDANRTYAFSRSAEQQNNLEQATYEQLVAGELAAHAFRQVNLAEARYLVALTYGVRQDTMTVAQPVYYANPWPYYWGRPVDPWGPWGPMAPFPAGYVNQSYPVFAHRLSLRMTERGSGKEVYRVQARNIDEQPALVYAMPYLVRSALADFPLGNGVVRTVRIPLSPNTPARSELPMTAPASAMPVAGAASAAPATVKTGQ
ncbi:DUF4136 domain-containing protein [Paraburkholderia bonniea]|uniref:DUF4136 domain-containing protein n=1 Tax=Paraburkholderia bonniea TaxID=2152891 RepID=UPI0012912D5E|nr:DUF4136 domain-containing protein [Paraburkholderia bonniea]WJF90967.1 DUF4136 domain-containing protein [Paraburkholderia bonniea]WJF94281.1 DUF4136 domain-containing protein [Paraburkholderia bonniea]